ncbi:MAG: Uridylate kinase [Candidatus Bathyarchaeota archaeon BA2]|nr:MAG: Uridylate kinase [Candidatus Bathyarchaeota archaeon BA2]
MEAVMKIGGSLAEDPASLNALCQWLGILAKTHKILIVPGGGKLADIVREIDQSFGLSDVIAHKMAILAMDQFGLFLSDVTPNSCVSYTLEKAKKFSAAGMLPIILPSKLMFRKDSLEHSWDVTSDSVAAFVAGLVNARKLVLVKDVDGIFTSDPKRSEEARLIREVSVHDLLKFGGTCVDRALPGVLLETKIDCYVVNGNYPERIKAILEDEPTICTRVLLLNESQK